MLKTNKFFVSASTALTLSVMAFDAAATPVIEIALPVSHALLAQSDFPANSFASSLANGSASDKLYAQLPAPLASPAPVVSKAREPAASAALPSEWSMLLVGAGVLLLPRQRRATTLFADQRSPA